MRGFAKKAQPDPIVCKTRTHVLVGDYLGLLLVLFYETRSELGSDEIDVSYYWVNKESAKLELHTQNGATSCDFTR